MPLDSCARVGMLWFLGAVTYYHLFRSWMTYLYIFIFVFFNIIFYPRYIWFQRSLKIETKNTKLGTVCSQQTVVQKNSIDALHQNWDPLVQTTGLSSLARVLLLLLLLSLSLLLYFLYSACKKLVTTCSNRLKVVQCLAHACRMKTVSPSRTRRPETSVTECCFCVWHLANVYIVVS